MITNSLNGGKEGRVRRRGGNERWREGGGGVSMRNGERKRGKGKGKEQRGEEQRRQGERREEEERRGGESSRGEGRGTREEKIKTMRREQVRSRWSLARPLLQCLTN